MIQQRTAVPVAAMWFSDDDVQQLRLVTKAGLSVEARVDQDRGKAGRTTIVGNVDLESAAAEVVDCDALPNPLDVLRVGPIEMSSALEVGKVCKELLRELTLWHFSDHVSHRSGRLTGRTAESSSTPRP